jgi:hypothetical protein
MILSWQLAQCNLMCRSFLDSTLAHQYNDQLVQNIYEEVKSGRETIGDPWSCISIDLLIALNHIYTWLMLCGHCLDMFVVERNHKQFWNMYGCFSDYSGYEYDNLFLLSNIYSNRLTLVLFCCLCSIPQRSRGLTLGQATQLKELLHRRPLIQVLM